MTRLLRLVALALGSLLVMAACGSPQQTGSEELLGFEEQRDAEALGREPDTTPQPLSVVEDTPTPTAAAATEAPEATPVYFDVALVTDSPFYEPGNCIFIATGVTLRVTNNDTAAERQDGRTFTDKAGTFHSGRLAPGESWTFVFSEPRSYEIIDQGLTFATAVLHVGQGSCQ